MNQSTPGSDLVGIENATVLERDNHPISRKQISPNAVKVLYKLTEAGYHGFLVGGGSARLIAGQKS